jgi:hypothetical protein
VQLRLALLFERVEKQRVTEKEGQLTNPNYDSI